MGERYVRAGGRRHKGEKRDRTSDECYMALNADGPIEMASGSQLEQ